MLVEFNLYSELCRDTFKLMMNELMMNVKEFLEMMHLT